MSDPEHPSIPLAHALGILRGVTDGLADIPIADIPAPDALRALHDLRESLRALGVLDANLVRHIYLHGEHGDVRIDGLPPAKIMRGRDRKSWDERGVTFAYVEAKLRETGEQPDPSDVVTWVLEVLGSARPRVTPLRAVGLEPDDYCTSEPGKVSVVFSECNENRQPEGYGGQDGNSCGLLHRAARWGDYAPAIARWEHILGSPAPAPTMTSTKGNPQLSAAFVEWLMGLPAGWVTDTPGITRNEALKALGNGVVPQQATAALRWMLAHIAGFGTPAADVSP